MVAKTAQKKKQTRKIKPFRTIKHVNMIGKGSGAYISCGVSGSGSQNSYAIVIADCGQQVELHGSLGTIDSRRNALYKINILIDELTNMKNHIITESKRVGLKIY